MLTLSQPFALGDGWFVTREQAMCSCSNPDCPRRDGEEFDVWIITRMHPYVAAFAEFKPLTTMTYTVRRQAMEYEPYDQWLN